jgi:hypothetical protein
MYRFRIEEKDKKYIVHCERYGGSGNWIITSSYTFKTAQLAVEWVRPVQPGTPLKKIKNGAIINFNE